MKRIGGNFELLENWSSIFEKNTHSFLNEFTFTAFLDLSTHGKIRQSEKIAACFELDAKSLLELAADIKLTKNDFPGAISLYRQSGCKHLKAVWKFAASGHVQVSQQERNDP